jgi:magnesium-transporting ATPase (P-type)
MDDDRGRSWLLFAGIVLMVGGVMRFFDALWAFHYHGVLPQNLEDAIFGHSLSTYGWLWLVVAIVVFLSGLLVMSQSQMAQWTGQVGRWIGVLAGAIISITAIWWIPYYPIWSLLYIGLGVLVIYALIAHGQRQEA